MERIEYWLLFVSVYFCAIVIGRGIDKIKDKQSSIIKNQIIILKRLDILKIKE